MSASARSASCSLVLWWLIRSPWGRAFVALRENPVRALSLGIDTRRYTLMAFAIGSALGGVAGTLYAPLTQYIDPVPFNLSLSLDLLMMVIVGGAGFFFGPFLGAMIAVLLPEWLRFTEGYYLMLYAVAVIVLLIYSPTGILGILDRYLDRAPHQGGLRAARGREIQTGDGAMTAVLEVSNIRKNFGGITAVDGVSFDVQEGEILGLIGPNGCGKSTLFNCILGQLTPSGGEVKVDGKVVTGLRPSGAEPARRQPHLPAAAGVSEIVGAGKSDPRRAGAPGQHAVAAVRSRPTRD